MAMIRKRRPNEPNSIIDSPKKLLTYLESQSIQTNPLNVDKAAEALGISIKYIDFGSQKTAEFKQNLSGVLRQKENSWEILVNSAHHRNRQRYTIAHEIGHYCLHRYTIKLFEDTTFFRTMVPNQAECDANIFAAEILMPEENFRNQVKNEDSIDELANSFQVSTLAVRVRAKQLGYTGHGL